MHRFSFFTFIFFVMNVSYLIGDNSYTSFVVDARGDAPYTSIQSAIDAASSLSGNQTILVRSGTYRENLQFNSGSLTLLGAVALGDEGQCEIIGMHTPPLSGSLIVRNFKLTSPSDIFSSSVSGTAELTIMNSLLSANGYTWNLPNWTGSIRMFDINDSLGPNDGVIYNLAHATFNICQAGLGAGNAKTMVLSGVVVAQSSSIGCPLQLVQGASFHFDDTIFSNPVTCLGNAMGRFFFCTMIGGVQPSLTMNSSGDISLVQSVIDSSNSKAIDGNGSGELALGALAFLQNSSINSALNILNATSLGAFTASKLTSKGDITLQGDVIFPAFGSGIDIKGGTNARIGQATLNQGMVFVANQTVTANTLVFFSRKSSNGSSNLGELSLLRVDPGQGFYIQSLDSYQLSKQPGDQSILSWFLVETLP